MLLGFGMFMRSRHRIGLHKIFQGCLLFDLVVAVGLMAILDWKLMVALASARFSLYAQDCFLSYQFLETILQFLEDAACLLTRPTRKNYKRAGYDNEKLDAAILGLKTDQKLKDEERGSLKKLKQQYLQKNDSSADEEARFVNVSIRRQRNKLSLTSDSIRSKKSSKKKQRK